MDSASSEEDDEPEEATSVQQLLRARLEADDSDAASEEDEPAQPEAASASTATCDAAGSTESSETLPSALDVLDPALARPDFLHVAGPEFDASKKFKPPPVTAADFGPVNERHIRAAPAAGEEQRAHSEYDWGRGGRPEGGRLRGSVCIETDDERGRRVKYGAHAMLKADPWSACNPNYAMNDSSVTRGKDRGRASNPSLGKRKLGGERI